MKSKKTSKPIFSIIVPVYNTDFAFLSECLESILSQTYKNFEVLVINDGSNKKTRAFLEDYKKRKQLKIIHQKHKGVSAARNKGLSIAKGQYIMFVDSDDYIDSETLEHTIKEIRKTSLDCLNFNYQELLNNGSKIKNEHPIFKLKQIDVKKDFALILSQLFMVCGKVFKNDDKLPRFNEDLTKLEDLAFLIEYYLKEPEISMLNKPYYTYRQHSNATTKNEQLAFDGEIFKSAIYALNLTQNSSIKAKIGERYTVSILREIKRFFATRIWPLEYRKNVCKFLMTIYSPDMRQLPEYYELCALYRQQILLSFKQKWEQIFDYRLNGETLNLKIFKKTFQIKLTPVVRFLVRHLLHFKNDVDLIYTWCDNNDTKWRKKRLKFLQKFNPTLATSASNCCRFVDNDELKHSLRSVELYAPWVHKIYIITDGQIPKWLDTSNKKIQIIDHKDIIEKKYLPTFNSNVIESYIHHIKGLSEYFLLANDDTFFGSPVSKDFFFSSDGKPYARFHKMPSIYKIIGSPYLQTIVHMVYVYQKYSKKEFFLDTHHNIDAYTKKICNRTETVFKKRYDEWRQHTFRTKKDFQRILIFYQALDEKKAILKLQPTNIRRNIDSMLFRLGREDIKECLFHYKPKLFCINDNEKTTDKDRKQIKKLYQELFPDKSSFEK